MTTAFVLSGGGSLGVVQVGMLRALTARGIEPDLLVGTPAGALNAAFVAGHGLAAASLDRLAAVWTKLRRHHVFPLTPARLTAAALGLVPSVCPNDGLRRLIERHVTFARLEDAVLPAPTAVPLSVSSADFRHRALLVERARTATTRWLDEGGHRLPHPERFLSLHHHPPSVHSVTCPGERAA